MLQINLQTIKYEITSNRKPNICIHVQIGFGQQKT